MALRFGDISLFILLCLAAATRADLGGGGCDCLKEIGGGGDSGGRSNAEHIVEVVVVGWQLLLLSDP